jgi:hypothetical protein
MVWSVKRHEPHLVSRTTRGEVARALLMATLISCSCGTRAESDSIYTSIRPADCAPPAADVASPYAAAHLGVQQCPAPAGWRLLVVASDENTWIDLAGPGVAWSGEKPIVYESPIGNFPSVGAPATVEWRRDNRGRPVALIVRVTAQDRESLEKRLSTLYVVRLQRSGACVIGRAATNDEARRLADGGAVCGR